MDNYIKRRAAFYKLVTIVDANNGEITTHHQSVKRVYNNENDVIMVEMKDGSHCLACDLCFDILDFIVKEWI